MKKISKRLFATVLAVAMFAALSIGAFAGNVSRTVKHEGYSCLCELSVSSRKASLSLNCTPIPYEMFPADPDVIVSGTVYDVYGEVLDFFYAPGIEKASDSVSGSISSATGFYYFKGYQLTSLSSTAFD